MFKSDLPPLKSRIIGYIVSVPLSFFIALFYGLPAGLCLLTSAAFALLFLTATILELRSKRKD